MTVRTTALGDLPRESIGQPDAVVLPDPATVFKRRAERLLVLAVAHPMADWLRFLALIAEAQQKGYDAVAMAPAGLPRMADQADGMPPIPAESTCPDASFNAILSHIIAAVGHPSIPEVARSVLANLATLDVNALAEVLAKRNDAGEICG